MISLLRLFYLSWLVTLGFTWYKALNPFPVLFIKRTEVWSVPCPPPLRISAENPTFTSFQQCLPTTAVMVLVVQIPLFSAVVFPSILVWQKARLWQKALLVHIHKHAQGQADPHCEV